MKKVTELTDKEVIHCPTEQEAEAICLLMHEAGLTWSTGNSYLGRTQWDNRESEMCYRPTRGSWGSEDIYRSDGFIIHPASLFLPPEFYQDNERYPCPPYKGDIKDFPKEVVWKMLDRQEEQGNKRDKGVFEEINHRGRPSGGFDWETSPEGISFWGEVISDKNFDLFFELYPKTDTPKIVEGYPKDTDGNDLVVGGVYDVNLLDLDYYLDSVTITSITKNSILGVTSSGGQAIIPYDKSRNAVFIKVSKQTAERVYPEENPLDSPPTEHVFGKTMKLKDIHCSVFDTEAIEKRIKQLKTTEVEAVSFTKQKTIKKWQI
jgi:hypothetical protein